MSSLGQAHPETQKSSGGIFCLRTSWENVAVRIHGGF